MKSTYSDFFDKIKITEILNGIPHGAVILDRDLCIVEMNSSLELLSGFTTSEARGVRADLILRCNIGKSGKLFRKLFETGESLSVEGNIITHDHKKKPIHFTVSPFKDENDHPVGLFIFL